MVTFSFCQLPASTGRLDSNQSASLGQADDKLAGSTLEQNVIWRYETHDDEGLLICCRDQPAHQGLQ